MKEVNPDDHPTLDSLRKAIDQAFYEDMPQVISDLHNVFAEYDLNQRQAVFACACALNQMASVEMGARPRIVKIEVSDAVQDIK